MSDVNSNIITLYYCKIYKIYLFKLFFVWNYTIIKKFKEILKIIQINLAQ